MNIDSGLYEPVCVEIQISEVMEEAIEATLETVDVFNMCILVLYTLSKKSYTTADFPYWHERPWPANKPPIPPLPAPSQSHFA